MGSLNWVRAARKMVGLAPLPEYPNLEALLEAQNGQVSFDYYILARVVPTIVGILGGLTFIGLAFTVNAFFIFGIIGSGAIAAGLWFLLDWLDKLIPRSRARLRKLGEEIWKRYEGFGNSLGISPALSPGVATILDEAAAIYLKHSNPRAPQKVANDPRSKALQALEESMAQMLELARPTTVLAQDHELSTGWAQPMLQEMREMDRALDQHMQAALAAQAIDSADPLANLRDARQELQGNRTAMDELENRLSN